MRKAVTSFTVDYILTAIAFIMIGILFLVDPDTSGKIICYILGGILCVIGAVRTFDYFRMPVQMPDYNLGLVNGIIFVGLGVFILAKPAVVISILPIVLGIAILVDSLIKLQNAVDMLRIHENGWMYTLIVAVIAAILGVVMLVNPFKTSEALFKFGGIVFIINGIIDISALLILRNRVKNAAQNI